ncbi:hypothetical protein BC941DRAFT_474786 [Chlamydoabsidia padenii]|nr:hypothetical protein BC941DRAFT_474786 [Chlamydoabsidia padenii]
MVFFRWGSYRLQQISPSSFIFNSEKPNLTEGDSRQRLPIFTNSISTDGYTVDVRFTRQTTKSTLPDLDMNDFNRNHLHQQHFNNHFRLWAVDPGIKDIYCATDGQSEY